MAYPLQDEAGVVLTPVFVMGEVWRFNRTQDFAGNLAPQLNTFCDQLNDRLFNMTDRANKDTS